jgi:queuine tRNA-ribosyltransferase
MGVGTPLDIIESIALGVDMFDCVMPTRNGRNGTLFTSQGKVNIKNQSHKFDDSPLDKDCSCYTCQNFSRGYLRHLYAAGELTALRLLSLHNLTYYLKLIKDIRNAIDNGKFQELLSHHRELWDR